jgi:membrane-bound lytic murein transglycosylase D
MNQEQKQSFIIVISMLVAVLFFSGGLPWLKDSSVSKPTPEKNSPVITQNTTPETDESPNLPNSTGDSNWENHLLKMTENKNSQNTHSLPNALKPLEETFKVYETGTASTQDIFAKRFSSLFKDNMPSESVDLFQIPQGLEPNVAFWVHVFGTYDKEQIIFYHEKDVGIVYSVLDLSDLSATDKQKTSVSELIRFEKKRIKQMIQNISKAQKDSELAEKLTDEEKRILSLWKTQRKEKFSEKKLTRALTYRRGYSHQFRKAIVKSGTYMEEMRRIFSEKGLPAELTMIPFIESSFHLIAYSHAKAAGIWQFIPTTGKRYLKIDEFVDERYDPILATHAAAAHLSHEYSFLKDWPATINAYNTGPGRMQKALQKFGNDMAKIVKEFDYPGYGFDSRNYFPEFLAALHVYHNQEKYFGGEVPQMPPAQFEYIETDDETDVKALARLAFNDFRELADLNPGLRDDVLSGIKPLPKGYLLRVPSLRKSNVLAATKKIKIENRFASSHIVQEGDTLLSVAKKYDVSAQDLAMENMMVDGGELKKGTVLKIPQSSLDFKFSKIKSEKTTY